MKTIKTIKLLSIMLLFIVATITTSCKKDNNGGGGSSSGKTGTFSIDGVSYAGKVSVQTFVNDNYSILCEQDSPYKLLQITFHSKVDADGGGDMNVEDFSINIASRDVNIGVDGLTFDPDGIYKIGVVANKITITNVKLKQTGGGSKNRIINSASINF